MYVHVLLLRCVAYIIAYFNSMFSVFLVYVYVAISK